MSRLGRLWLALALLLAWLPALPASALQGPAVPVPASQIYTQVKPPPRLWAHGAVLLDWQTGEVIWGQNAHRRLHPASTTKILTALIAAESGKLDSLVTISRRAALTGGSSMHIKQGEVYSLHDLLHGLLLRSGNDAAVAIAEHIAGSVEGFARLMNARAEAAGARNSHFMNPHGLTHDQHLSTAYDLAVITRDALKNSFIAAIVALPSKELTYEELDRRAVLYNTNKLLSWLPGADGVKTGTTGAAGACLIASATREEQKLITVVLHAASRWQESVNLLEWGFGNWQLARLGRAGEVVRWLPVQGGKRASVPVALKQDLAVVLPRNDGDLPEMGFGLPVNLQAPLEKGQFLGYAGVAHPEEGLQHRIELVAAEAVPAATWLDRLYQFLTTLLGAADDLGIHLMDP